MTMKQSLTLKLSQHLALTPQLQQSIRLLQLSTLELNQEIEQALRDNPLLEREDFGDSPSSSYALPGEPGTISSGDVTLNSSAGNETSHEAPASDGSAEPEGDSWSEEAGWGAEQGSGNHGPRDPNDDDVDAGEIQAAATSLQDHLLQQLALTQLPEHDKQWVAFLIEALDDDGYLTQTMDELAEVVPAKLGLSEEEIAEELSIALKHLQNFDPPGIAARSPAECLALQLHNLPADATRDLALAIVDQCLELLANRDFARIKKMLGCDDDALRTAQAMIRSLNPRPGAAYTTTDTRYIVPDVIVRKQRGAWVASLNNDAMPRLRINRLYADLLQRNRAGNSGLTGQLQEARWLIKNVQQRFDTILRVSQAIVERQRAFFDHGDVAMRPLTLREIADTVNLHESTISRVTTQKYLASPRGIFELKYFFGSHVATDTGGAASSTAIRALIKQLVSAEDGHKPLSDARIAEILGEQGIKVARRTVAKYRESLNIPPVNLRKTL